MSTGTIPTRALDPTTCAELVQSDRWDRKTRTTSGDCIEWVGARNDQGYGQCRLGGRVAYAHRIAYVAASGADLPYGMVIDHLCRNRSCCNPAHLECVTVQVNSARGVRPERPKPLHCANGHDFSPENRLPKSKGCRPCVDEAVRARNELVNQARKYLGLSQDQYIARFGRSSAVARAFIEATAASES